MSPIVGPAKRRARPGGHAGSEARHEEASPAARVDGANPSDPGVGLLARAVAGAPPREVLLVACGDIPGIGPAATRLVLDVRELEQPGARPMSLHPHAIPGGFAHALVWPRAHLGKDFTFACLAAGALACKPGGTLWCSVRKAKGADSIAALLERLTGDVTVHARDRGYRLLRAPIGPALATEEAEAALAVRYQFGDPCLGDVQLQAVPGVFSRRGLDDGTRALIEHAAAAVRTAPSRVLDLGAGVGPLTCWAARRWPSAHVLAVEPNLLAADCCEANAQAAGVANRVTVMRSAGLPMIKMLNKRADGPHLRNLAGAIDLALVNPPTHAAPEALERIVADALAWLAPHGQAMFVVRRASILAAPLRRLGGKAPASPGAAVSEHAASGYTVVVAGRPC